MSAEEYLGSEVYEEVLADIEASIPGVDFTDTSNLSAVTAKLNNAIREVVKARDYPDTYTDDKITNDLQRFISNIINITIYDFHQIGGAFQETHNENSINRTWVDRSKMFKGINRFVK